MYKPYDEKVMIGYDRMLRVKELLSLGVIKSPWSEMFFETDEEKANKKLIYKMITLNSSDYEKIKEDIIAFKKMNLSQEEILEKINLFLEETNNVLKEELISLGIDLSSLYKLDNPYVEPYSRSRNKEWAKYYVNCPLQIDKDMFSNPFYNYKVYASFENLKDLTKENIEQILNDLSELGFRGAFKVIGNTTRLNSSDQMCFYATLPSEQKMLYEYLSSLDILKEVNCGIDSGMYSFSTTLSNGTFFNTTRGVNISERQELIKEFIDCIYANNLFEKNRFGKMELNEENLILAIEKSIERINMDENTKTAYMKKFFDALKEQENPKINEFFETRQELIKDFIESMNEHILTDLNKFLKSIKLNEENLNLLIEKNIEILKQTDSDFTKKYISESFIELLNSKGINKEKIEEYKILLNINNSEEKDTYFDNERWEWKHKFSTENLSIEFLEEYKHKSDTFGEDIAKNPYITKEIIEKFKDEINFKELSKNKDLSIELIKEYKDLLDIEEVSSYNSNLTYDFLKENIETFDIYQLMNNNNLNLEIKKTLRNEFDKLFQLEDKIKHSYGLITKNYTFILQNIDDFSDNQLDKLANKYEKIETKIFTNEEVETSSNPFKEYKLLKENYDLTKLKEDLENKALELNELPKEILENKLFIGNLILEQKINLEQLPENLQQDDLYQKLDKEVQEKKKIDLEL